MEFVANPVPISPVQITAGHVICFVYFILRNATLALLLIYLFYVTRTEYRKKQKA